MILAVLGLFDIAVGVVLAVSQLLEFAGNGTLFIVALLMLLKGLFSVLTAAGSGFYLDVLGWLDLIAAVSMFLIYLGLVHEFFLYFGLLMIVKGLYSFGMGLVDTR